MEKHIRQIFSELSKYRSTENEKRKSSLFKELVCPYCGTSIDSLEDLVVNPLTQQPECEMCIEIRVACEGEYRR